MLYLVVDMVKGIIIGRDEVLVWLTICWFTAFLCCHFLPILLSLGEVPLSHKSPLRRPMGNHLLLSIVLCVIYIIGSLFQQVDPVCHRCKNHTLHRVSNRIDDFTHASRRTTSCWDIAEDKDNDEHNCKGWESKLTVPMNLDMFYWGCLAPGCNWSQEKRYLGSPLGQGQHNVEDSRTFCQTYSARESHSYEVQRLWNVKR